MIKRIMIVSRGYPTAANPLNGIFELDQARALAAYRPDAEVAFLALDFNKDSRGKIGLNVFERDGVKVYHLLLPTGVYRRGLPALKFILRRVYGRAVRDLGKPDIIHSHFYFMGALCEALRPYGIPMVHTEHSSKLNKNLDLISALDRRLARMAYAASDRIIAVSSVLSDRLRLNFAADAIVIPNIVDASVFERSAAESCDHKGFRFVSAGLLIPRKGFGKLIEAFAAANFTDDVSLDIIGDGPERENLRSLISALGLEGRVRLTGHKSREEMAGIYHASDAFVLLSENETFGVVYIEAIAAGLPVIASRCGGPEDFINDSVGRIIDASDPAQTASALRTFAERRLSFDPLAIANQTKARFSPNAVAEEIFKVYEKLEVRG